MKLIHMKNQVVIITGASSGIGKALAFEFGRKGAQIVITGRNEQNLLSTEAELKAAGIAAIGIVCDSASEEQSRAMVAQVIQLFGRIDLLINNAGISMRSMFAKEIKFQSITDEICEGSFNGNPSINKRT